MKVTITTELNAASPIPRWLVEAVHAADQAGVPLTITTGNVYKITRPRKSAKP